MSGALSSRMPFNAEQAPKRNMDGTTHSEKVKGEQKRADEKDTDGDGVPDREEADLKTDPFDADTDDDGLSDGQECGRFNLRDFKFYMQDTNLNPTNPDSDGDGLPDGLELGVTVPVMGKGNTKGTDLDATFTCMTEFPVVQIKRTRICFISDKDPLSITDPGNWDSNGDGLSDGYQDANANGKADPGETDPAAGLASMDNLNFVGGWLSKEANPLRLVYDANGKMDVARDMSVFWINYQSSINGAPPEVVISRPDCLRVRKIYPQQLGTRMQIIAIEWVKECDEIIDVYLKSPYLIHGQTGPIYIKTLSATKLNKTK